MTIDREDEDKLIEAFNTLKVEKRKMFRQYLKLKELDKHVNENGEIRIEERDLRNWLNTQEQHNERRS